MSARDERVRDLFFDVPDSPGNPTEEGQVRLNAAEDDIVAYIDGSVKSLTATSAIFGSQLNSGEALAETSTTGGWAQKLRVTTPVVPAGDYIICWLAEIRANPSGNMRARVELDDTTTLSQVRKFRNGYMSYSGKRRVTLTNAAHDVDLDYRAVSGTAFIRTATIILWRLN